MWLARTTSWLRGLDVGMGNNYFPMPCIDLSLILKSYCVFSWLSCKIRTHEALRRSIPLQWRHMNGMASQIMALVTRGTLLGYNSDTVSCSIQFQNHCNSVEIRRPIVVSNSQMSSSGLNHAIAWWRHQMETFFASLAIVRGIRRSPVKSHHKGQWHGCFLWSVPEQTVE